MISLAWPLPADSALMHYVGFLIRSGWAPYRDIIDVNLPLSYAPDTRLGFDPARAALLWRLFDLGLICGIFWGFCKAAGPSETIAAAWAAGLFAVIHLRDGIEQSGERDLTAGLILLLSVVALLRGDHRRPGKFLLFGAGVGLATLIRAFTQWVYSLILCRG